MSIHHGFCGLMLLMLLPFSPHVLGFWQTHVSGCVFYIIFSYYISYICNAQPYIYIIHTPLYKSYKIVMIYGIITLIYIVIYTLLFTHLNVPHIVVGIMSMSSPFDPKELTMRGKHLPRPTTVRRPCPLCVNGSRS